MSIPTTRKTLIFSHKQAVEPSGAAEILSARTVQANKKSDIYAARGAKVFTSLALNRTCSSTHEKNYNHKLCFLEHQVPFSQAIFKLPSASATTVPPLPAPVYNLTVTTNFPPKTNYTAICLERRVQTRRGGDYRLN